MSSIPPVQASGHASTAEVVVPTRRIGHYLYSAVFLALLLVPVLLHSLLGIAISPVLSGSMKPVFNPGDALITKETKVLNLRVGDIVVLRNASDYSLFSHRITSIKNVDFQIVINTKGDNNPVADAGAVKVNPLQLIPREIGHVPFLGGEVVFFTSNKGRLVSYILIGLALLLSIARYFGRKTLAKHHSLNLHMPHLHHEKQPTFAGVVPSEVDESSTDSTVQLQDLGISSNATTDYKGDNV